MGGTQRAQQAERGHISDRTDNGGKLRILSVLDEHSRACLALHVARQLTAADLIAVMEKLVTQRGVPGHIRSDNGSEFVARTLQSWLAERQVKPSTSNRAVPGRTDTWKASMARCATSAWIGS